MTDQEPQKRRPGRPRKNPAPVESPSTQPSTAPAVKVSTGRPVGPSVRVVTGVLKKRIPLNANGTPRAMTFNVNALPNNPSDPLSGLA